MLISNISWPRSRAKREKCALSLPRDFVNVYWMFYQLIIDSSIIHQNIFHRFMTWWQWHMTHDICSVKYCWYMTFLLKVTWYTTHDSFLDYEANYFHPLKEIILVMKLERRTVIWRYYYNTMWKDRIRHQDIKDQFLIVSFYIIEMVNECFQIEGFLKVSLEQMYSHTEDWERDRETERDREEITFYYIQYLGNSYRITQML